jgi:crotonobetainyl-CoA:carnitine CoA-transferase CaiB-like acyl-CoA transferase
VLGHPQTHALGMIVQPEGSELRLTATPLRFDGDRPSIRSIPPKVGEHTAILSETREFTQEPTLKRLGTTQ